MAPRELIDAFGQLVDKRRKPPLELVGGQLRSPVEHLLAWLLDRQNPAAWVMGDDERALRPQVPVRGEKFALLAIDGHEKSVAPRIPLDGESESVAWRSPCSRDLDQPVLTPTT